MCTEKAECKQISMYVMYTGREIKDWHAVLRQYNYAGQAAMYSTEQCTQDRQVSTQYTRQAGLYTELTTMHIELGKTGRQIVCKQQKYN